MSWELKNKAKLRPVTYNLKLVQKVITVKIIQFCEIKEKRLVSVGTETGANKSTVCTVPPTVPKH